MPYQDRSNYSEQTIQRVLYDYFKKMKYRMSNIYMFYKWESDFFFVSDTNNTYEIEIKVDRQDFHREFELKDKKHKLLLEAYESDNEKCLFLPNYFYFCAPEGVIPHEEIPEYANLIEIFDKDKVRYVKSTSKVHNVTKDIDSKLLKKFYSKTLSMEQMLSDFRIKIYKDPDKRDEILKKFLKRLRI